MKTKLLITVLLLALSGCAKKIYLSPEGRVVGLRNGYVEVKFDCSNVRRPDCYAILDVDRTLLGEVSLGQKLKLN